MGKGNADEATHSEDGVTTDAGKAQKALRRAAHNGCLFALADLR